MDLIRKLILEVESRDESSSASPISFEGYSEETLEFHRALLEDDGTLVTGHSFSSRAGIETHLDALTWQGHDFADAIRNETLWRRTMDAIKDKGVEVTVGMLVAYLKAKAVQLLGLPAGTE